MRRVLCLSLALLMPLPALAEPAPRALVTERVQAETPEIARFTGVIEATATVGVAFELVGRLTERPVQVGERVEPGQILARLDARALEDDRNAAAAVVESLAVKLQTSSRALARAQDLAGRGVSSTSSLETARRDEAVARANLAEARARLARAEDAVGRALLRAPFEGIVLDVRQEPGSVIAAGDPVVVLASPGGRNVVLTLPAALVQAPAEAFRITSPKLQQSGVTGRLLRVDPASVRETRLRRAWIELGPEAAGLAIGELVSVAPEGAALRHVSLPVQAILPGSDPAVWVVDDTQGARRLHKRGVRLIETPQDRARVTVEGLEPGTEVLIRGVQSVREGQAAGPALALPASPPGTQPPPLVSEPMDAL